jgi:hypothetical protein
LKTNIVSFIFKGTYFGHGYDPQPHAWNAVFFYGGWRLVDCTWGAGRVNPETNQFEKQLNEHFFLTDADEMIYTHYPYDEAENKYDRWQLLTRPVPLETFNTMPLLNSMFFEYSLKISQDLPQPIITSDTIEIRIWAWEVARYKYKFFAANKVLNKTEKSFSNLAARNGEIFNVQFVQIIFNTYLVSQIPSLCKLVSQILVAKVT